MILLSGLAVASNNQNKRKSKLRKRSSMKVKSRKVITVRHVETDFDHGAIHEQLPESMEELQDLYERDFPR